MQIQNIDRILLFREDGGAVLTLGQLQAQYGIEPDGTNFYYGVNQTNVGEFSQTGQALSPTRHRPVLDALMSALAASASDEKTLNLGLEPTEPGDPNGPYSYVSDHTDVLQALASELNTYQTQARAIGKRLNIVVRYASEMNDKNVYGQDPPSYKTSFQLVRGIFRLAAPGVLFAFSPAIRQDLFQAQAGEAGLHAYWPGDDLVDVISCTWYIHGQDQFRDATDFMRLYFLHRAGTGKSFGIDELGGADANWQNDDTMLQEMFHELEALQIQSVGFKYVTVFLQAPWGADASLSFL